MAKLLPFFREDCKKEIGLLISPDKAGIPRVIPTKGGISWIKAKAGILSADKSR